jgi:hypothetical protein
VIVLSNNDLLPAAEEPSKVRPSGQARLAPTRQIDAKRLY